MWFIPPFWVLFVCCFFVFFVLFLFVFFSFFFYVLNLTITGDDILFSLKKWVVRYIIVVALNVLSKTWDHFNLSTNYSNTGYQIKDVRYSIVIFNLISRSIITMTIHEPWPKDSSQQSVRCQGNMLSPFLHKHDMFCWA